MVVSTLDSHKPSQKDEVPSMQRYLEEKYGQKENFQFTGDCQGGIDAEFQCDFRSDATGDQSFYVKGTGPHTDNYLDVKFRRSAEDYFQNIFRDISKVDSRIQNVRVSSVAPRFVQNGRANEREPVNSTTFETFINDDGVNIDLSVDVTIDDTMLQEVTSNKYKWQVKQPIRVELEQTLFSVLQEKHVTKNIGCITFWDAEFRAKEKPDTDVSPFCMSYTTHPNPYRDDCVNY